MSRARQVFGAVEQAAPQPELEPFRDLDCTIIVPLVEKSALCGLVPGCD